MHALNINAILLTMCHSDMFQPSKGHLQAGTTDTIQQQDQQNGLPDVKFCKSNKT